MRHHVIDDANARGAMAASLGRWVVWTSRALQLQLLARRSDFRSWALCLLCLSVLDRIDTSSLCHCLRTVVGGYCTLFIDIHRVTGEEVWSHNTTTVIRVALLVFHVVFIIYCSLCLQHTRLRASHSPP